MVLGNVGINTSIMVHGSGNMTLISWHHGPLLLLLDPAEFSASIAASYLLTVLTVSVSVAILLLKLLLLFH